MKTYTTAAALALIFVLCIAVGSVNIPPNEIFRIFASRLGFGTYENAAHSAIVLQLRLPRAVLAFLVGAMISVSGALMQSVLRNPLASPFTLGVSSGASLGAVVFMIFGISAALLMPAAGFAGAMAAMLVTIFIAKKIDASLGGTTIILTGMVLSLFVNALTTLLMALEREYIQRRIFWQMGSFSSRGMLPVNIMTPIAAVGIAAAIVHHRQMDLLSFGENTAQIAGVAVVRTKWLLLICAAVLAGSAISFVGIIGFVDLMTPHAVRRVFGARHLRLIPLCAVFGGGFMMLCDLAARTIVTPGELPVGVVTALAGAPFFAWVFFAGRKNAYG